MKVIVEVQETWQVNMNGRGFDMYKLKILEDGRVYVMIGSRPHFPRLLMAGEYIENMRAVGKLTHEEFCKAIYNMREIENGRKCQVPIGPTHYKTAKKVQAAPKGKPAPQVQQLRLF